MGINSGPTIPLRRPATASLATCMMCTTPKCTCPTSVLSSLITPTAASDRNGDKLRPHNTAAPARDSFFGHVHDVHHSEMHLSNLRAVIIDHSNRGLRSEWG